MALTIIGEMIEVFNKCVSISYEIVCVFNIANANTCLISTYNSNRAINTPPSRFAQLLLLE